MNYLIWFGSAAYAEIAFLVWLGQALIVAEFPEMFSHETASLQRRRNIRQVVEAVFWLPLVFWSGINDLWRDLTFRADRGGSN